MSTHQHTFDFHGVVSLSIETQSPWVKDYFSQEYGFAASSTDTTVPQVELRLNESALPRSPGGGYSFNAHKALARWFYRIQLGIDRILIDAVGNRASVPMVHHMLVHPALRYLSSKRGVLCLHGAALSRRGRSVAITGSGGAGKTTVSSLILEHGDASWRIQGDDYVFVDGGSRTLSYGTRAHLYRDLLKFLPGLASQLSNAERFHLAAFGSLRSLTGDRVKWPLRLPLKRLWPDRELEAEAKLGAVLLLKGERGEALSLEQRIDPAMAVDQMLSMNFHEARHFKRLVEKAPTGGRASDWWQAWQAAERALFEAMVGQAPLYRLTLPKHSNTPESLGGQLVSQLVALLDRAAVHE